MKPLFRMHAHRRGFTLLELIIAMTIFVTISSVILFRYNSFNKRLTLDTLAHETAQWVRQTQVSAMGVKKTSTSATVPYPGYGLHFDPQLTGQFVYFADNNGNKRYDPGSGVSCGAVGTECEKVIAFPKGTQISIVCGEVATTTGTPQTCPYPLMHAENMDIVFTRPNPDASILGNLSAVPDHVGTFSRGDIIISTPTGYTRTIEIWTTGQVRVY